MTTRSPFLSRSREYLEQTRSRETALVYVAWFRRYILHHHFQSADEMTQHAQDFLQAYLVHLACTVRVSANTQNQALCALLVLYNEILDVPIAEGWQRYKAKRPWCLPEVLNRQEALAVLDTMQGGTRIMAQLLYGSGLKVGECVGLRIAQLDMQQRTIALGTHQTILAQAVCEALQQRIEFVCGCYRLKGLTAATQYFVFPEAKLFDPDAAVCDYRHIHRSALQKALQAVAQKAQRTGSLLKSVSCQGLRDSFAVELLRQGTNIRQVQELLGIRDIRQVMRYVRCLPVREY